MRYQLGSPDELRVDFSLARPVTAHCVHMGAGAHPGAHFHWLGGRCRRNDDVRLRHALRQWHRRNHFQAALSPDSSVLIDGIGPPAPNKHFADFMDDSQSLQLRVRLLTGSENRHVGSICAR